MGLRSSEVSKKKKEKKNIAEARHVRRELTWEIFVRYFTKIPKILVEVGALVRVWV